jgi:hypothetical protein
MSLIDPKETCEAAICCDAKRCSHIPFLTNGRTRLLGFYQIRERKAGTRAEQQRSIPARQWEA